MRREVGQTAERLFARIDDRGPIAVLRIEERPQIAPRGGDGIEAAHERVMCGGRCFERLPRDGVLGKKKAVKGAFRRNEAERRRRLFRGLHA